MWTDGGRMGLVPAAASLGVRIYILFGGQVLYALRERGEGKWEFLGECYVHGLMDGEALSSRGEDEDEAQGFIVV